MATIQKLNNKPCKTYCGEEAIDKKWKWYEESEYCSKVIETEFNEPLATTEKEHEDFHNSSKFWICKTSYEESELKVKDHNHVTRYYQGSTHQKCNLNVNLSKKSPYCVY